MQQRIAASTAAEEVPAAELHLRASVWYEANGLEIEAFHHAAAANDIERAERLIEGQGIPLHLRGAMAVVVTWLASLPKAVLDARPSLWVRYAMLLLVTGQTTGVEEKLAAAEAALTGAEQDDRIRNLIGQIATARATLALTRYQLEPMLAQSRRALEYLHPDNQTNRVSAMWCQASAYFLRGDRTASGRVYREALAISQASGLTFSMILTATGLGEVQELETQLYQASETYRHVLKRAGDQPLPIVYEAHLGLGRVFYEWNNLSVSEEHGRQSLQLALAEPGGFIRLFVDEGTPMKQALQAAASRGLAPDYTQRLLAAFGPGGARRAIQSADVAALSERELEVLQQIAEGRTDRVIADRLYLSLHTVKVHARNIYNKLGVNNRTQAVTRARELGLLPHS